MHTKTISVFSITAVVVFTTAIGSSAGDFLTARAASGAQWGPTSRNLQLGIAIPNTIASVGAPVALQLYIKNSGREIVIDRTDSPLEYKVSIMDSTGKLVSPRKHMLFSFASSGATSPHIQSGEVYHTSFNLTSEFSLRPGAYTVRVVTDIYPGGPIDSGRPKGLIAALRSGQLGLVIR